MVSLHTHSYYSMLSAAVPLEGLIEKAKEYNLPALALTDTNGMYGLIQFYKKSLEAGIKPLPGAYIDEPDNPDIYVLLLARSREGYGDLCRIITSRKLKEDFSLFELLQKPLPELFILTPSIELLRSVPAHGNIFAELITLPSKRRETRRLYEFARERGIRYVATNPVWFLERDDYLLHKTVTVIRERSVLKNAEQFNLADEESYFKHPAELTDVWRRIPGALANLQYIIENCNVDLKLGEVKFPHFQVPSPEPSFSFLLRIAYEGLSKRYGNPDEIAVKRLNYELDVINELGFTDYFLVVWDIVREAMKRGMMLLGRGSAGNSLVSYCLEFTHVDPIKYDLYFERFLNRGRRTPPDIDLDFSWSERDEIVKYVFDKYGYDRVAMISTTVTFRARSAFRETAKVFGVADSEISEYSKFIPWTNARNLPSIADLFPESKALKFNHEPWKSIVGIASRLASYPRHLSIHPGGIVIAPEPITNYTALEYAGNKGLGLIVTQPDMYPVEDLGLIKIDLLSQRSLGVLRDTVNSIHKSPGKEDGNGKS